MTFFHVFFKNSLQYIPIISYNIITIATDFSFFGWWWWRCLATSQFNTTIASICGYHRINVIWTNCTTWSLSLVNFVDFSFRIKMYTDYGRSYYGISDYGKKNTYYGIHYLESQWRLSLKCTERRCWKLNELEFQTGKFVFENYYLWISREMG